MNLSNHREEQSDLGNALEEEVPRFGYDREVQSRLKTGPQITGMGDRET